MTETITIGNENFSARINSLGAELVDWSIAGRPLLWRSDSAIWARTSPLLFPVVGRSNNSQIKVDGTIYPMEIHGFASSSQFSVQKKSQNEAVLVLDQDAQTLVRYPFPFRLSVRYLIEEKTLSVGLRVKNTGETQMPYAIGLHPGFSWSRDSPNEDDETHCHKAYIDFQCEEVPYVPDLSSAGLFLDTMRKIPLDGRRLDLSDTLLENDALCFLNAKSKSVRYVSSDGSTIVVSTDNFPHFAFWSRAPGQFLCIETWTGHGDPEGYDGELSLKPSMRDLAPSCSANHSVQFEYCEQIQ